MVNNGGADNLLARLARRAEEDLRRHRRAATAWRWLDALLLVPAAFLAAAAVLAGIAGVTGRAEAALAAVAGAALAGISLVVDIPRRARRSTTAVSYLRAFVAEVGDGRFDNTPVDRDTVAALRGWYVKINVALDHDGDELDPELLEPPVANGGGGGHLNAAGDDGAGSARPVPATANGVDVHPEEDVPGDGAAERAGARHRHRLTWAFLLAVVFLFIEGVAAFLTRSLALLSDAGHVLTDAVGLGMALAAIHLASRKRRHPSRTFGLYRLEIMAALANAVLLLGVGVSVLREAFERFRDPVAVPGGAMLAVAVAGLAANVVAFFLLRPGAKESLNVRGAYLEVFADAIASVGLLLAGLVISLTGWYVIDPLVGGAIGLWILPRAGKLARDAIRILVQAAPPEIDVAALEAELKALEGVVDVHELHCWTLTSDMEVASAHLEVERAADTDRVLAEARALLRESYRINHITLQVECDRHPDCESSAW